MAFKADEETSRILELLEQHEERSRSEVIRRALRFHAEALGLIKVRPRALRADDEMKDPAVLQHPRAMATNRRKAGSDTER